MSQTAQLVQDAVPADSAIAATTELSESAATLASELARMLGLTTVGGNLILRILTIVVIFLFAWVIIKFVDRATRSWLNRYRDVPISDPSRQRAATLSDLFRSAIRYVAWPMATIMAFSEMGLDVAALIAPYRRLHCDPHAQI